MPDKDANASKGLPKIDYARISGNMAERFGIIPVAEEDNVTVFLSKSELSHMQLQELRFALGTRFRMAGALEFPDHLACFDQLLQLIPKLPDQLEPDDKNSVTNDPKPKPGRTR